MKYRPGMRPTLKDLRRETLMGVIIVAILWIFRIVNPDSYDTLPFRIGFDFFRLFGLPIFLFFYFVEKKKIERNR